MFFRLLVEAMRVELCARGVGFVMLRRLDRAGLTGLGSWYEGMGIHAIHDVLPAEVLYYYIIILFILLFYYFIILYYNNNSIIFYI
jgi:hypothetical protein